MSVFSSIRRSTRRRSRNGTISRAMETRERCLHRRRKRSPTSRQTVRIPDPFGNGRKSFTSGTAPGQNESKSGGALRSRAAWPEGGDYLIGDDGYPGHIDQRSPTPVGLNVPGPEDASHGDHHQRPARQKPQLVADPDRAHSSPSPLELCSSLVAGVRGRALHPDAVFDTDFSRRYSSDAGRRRLDRSAVACGDHAERRRRKNGAEARVQRAAYTESEIEPGDAFGVRLHHAATHVWRACSTRCLNFFPDEWQKVYNFQRRNHGPDLPRSRGSSVRGLQQLTRHYVIFLGLAAVLLAIGFGKPVEPAVAAANRGCAGNGIPGGRMTAAVRGPDALKGHCLAATSRSGPPNVGNREGNALAGASG